MVLLIGTQGGQTLENKAQQFDQPQSKAGETGAIEVATRDEGCKTDM